MIYHITTAKEMPALLLASLWLFLFTADFRLHPQKVRPEALKGSRHALVT